MPSENVNQDSLGYPEAQRLSGLGRKTLRTLISDGQLSAVKIGRAIRIEKHSLEKYMHDHDLAEQLRLFD